MFMPILFLVMLNCILSGPVYGLIVGVFGPLFLTILFPSNRILRDIIADSFFYATAAMVTGILYSVLKTAVGAVSSGFLVSTIVYGIVRIFTSLAVSSTYYLRPFLYESFIFCWPGIVITAAGVPALIVLFRHTGVMWAMRHERINRWEKRENS